MRFRDPGFASKSWHPVAALEFTGNACCIFVLEYTEPSKQIFLEGLTEKEEEHEILSYPGEQWEIVGDGLYTWEHNSPPIKAYYCRFIGYHVQKIEPNASIDKMYVKINDLLYDDNDPLRNGIIVYSSEKESVYFTKNEDLRLALRVHDEQVIYTNKQHDKDFEETVEYIYYMLQYSQFEFFDFSDLISRIPKSKNIYEEIKLHFDRVNIQFEENDDGIISQKFVKNKEDFRSLIMKVLDGDINYIRVEDKEIVIGIVEFK